MQFDENSSLTSISPDEELREPISYLPNFNVDESSGEERSNSNQHEPSPNLLTPFEHLSCDRHQEDEEFEGVENEINEDGDNEDTVSHLTETLVNKLYESGKPDRKKIY